MGRCVHVKHHAQVKTGMIILAAIIIGVISNNVIVISDRFSKANCFRHMGIQI